METRRATSTSPDPQTAARELHAALWAPDLALVIFYCAPTYDLAALGDALAELFGPTAPVIGCTTAGEITPIGYLEGSLTGVSLSGSDVHVHTERIDDLRSFALSSGAVTALRTIDELREKGARPTATNTFGLLLSDGLSMQEEGLVCTLYGALDGIQLFGGSAGDGLRFDATHLYHRGRFQSDCALFTLITTTAPFVVFKTDHFTTSTQKMVVTGAEPARRIVTEINGEPAAREYARMVGLEMDKLTPMIFAAHPVVLTIGGTTYVRSIQKVNDDESLSFFCAIDEGIVLTVAEPRDLVEDLAQAFDKVRKQIGPPVLVLGCDCILRSLEIGQKGQRADVSRILTENNVVGFATYGEQFNAVHVNQTFTGVAIGG